MRHDEWYAMSTRERDVAVASRVLGYPVLKNPAEVTSLPAVVAGPDSCALHRGPCNQIPLFPADLDCVGLANG